MELTRFNLSAIKRINANSKQVIKKLNKIKEKITALTEEYNQGVEEFKAVESWVVNKFGFYSEQILSGEADSIIASQAAQSTANTEELSASSEETVAMEEESSDINEDPFAN